MAGASPALAGLAVATLTAAGLVGDILVVGIVARVSGLRYLRFSSFAAGLVSCVPARPRPWPEAAGSLLPLGVGLIARAAGLGPAFWTMLLAPLALMVLVPADDEAPRRTS